jgi:hypothetical protein
VLALALALALAQAELPRPPFEAVGQFIYWDQCMVYGAEAMAGGDRAPEQILEIKLRDCLNHERRVQAELDAHQPSHAAAQMERFRAIIREQTLSAISRRRQPAPPTPK